MNKIILTEEDFFGEPQVLIFNNERDIVDYFKPCNVVFYNRSYKLDMVDVVSEYSIKKVYNLVWGKQC